MNNLHSNLRAGTENAHKQVDEAFGSLDLSAREDLARFLAAHRMALFVTESYFAALTHAFRAPPRMTHLLDEDLVSLGWSMPLDMEAPAPSLSSPWGVAYVVAGASMGRKVLQNRWRSSADPRVIAAGRFLTDSTMAEYWRYYKDELNKQDFSSSASEQAVKTGKACFTLFSVCLNNLRARHLL